MDEESMGVRDEIGFLPIHRLCGSLLPRNVGAAHAGTLSALCPWLFEDLAPAAGPASRRALLEREQVLAGRLRNSRGKMSPIAVARLAV
jgi:hypothetical protein